MKPSAFNVRPLVPTDHAWVACKMVEEWGAEVIYVHSETFRPAELPGFAAELDGEVIGLLTYRLAGKECEVMTLNSWRAGLGVGTALLEAARQAANRARCGRLYLVTTNDNTHALRFYQKRGFVINAVRLNVMEQARKVKPEIPPTGADGIPIRDEIELEMIL